MSLVYIPGKISVTRPVNLFISEKVSFDIVFILKEELISGNGNLKKPYSFDENFTFLFFA